MKDVVKIEFEGRCQDLFKGRRQDLFKERIQDLFKERSQDLIEELSQDFVGRTLSRLNLKDVVKTYSKDGDNI